MFAGDDRLPTGDYLVVGKVVKVLDRDAFDEFGIGHPQIRLHSVEIANEFAVFLHQMAVVLSPVLRNGSNRYLVNILL